MTTLLLAVLMLFQSTEVPPVPQGTPQGIPQPSDADRLALMTLQRDFNAALLQIRTREAQCKTDVESDTKAAIKVRDKLQALVDKLKAPTGAAYVLDLDKAANVPLKPKAAAKP